MSQLEEVFAQIEAAAVAGERAPQRDQLGASGCAAVSQLVREGRLSIDVYAHNWRVFTVLSGPHAGKQTKGSPLGRKPHLRIDKNGSWRGGRMVIPRPTGRQPSAPRPLTAEELK